MSSAILHAESLNLPEAFAVKLRGKKVVLTEKGNVITIRPVLNSIAAARGMFKGGNFGTDTIMEQKRLEKEHEYGEPVCP